MSCTQKYIDSVDGQAHQSAVEIIERLEKENKALEEENEKVMLESAHTTHDMLIVQQSRDELLEFVKDIGCRIGGDFNWEFKPAIQRAEDLKK